MRGVNLSRTYTIMTGDATERVEIRRPSLDESQALLTAATATGSRVDDLSKAMGLTRLAQEQSRAGDTQAAEATMTRAQGLRGARR